MKKQSMTGKQTIARRYDISGIVQGVGFRPFIHRLAIRQHINGSVYNTTEGVVILGEASRTELDRFKKAIRLQAPPLAVIEKISERAARKNGCRGFTIRKSARTKEEFSLVSPDIATCPDCLRELHDEKDRRYHYPFINCTNCGPRFTIVKDIPYDRVNTTMAGFEMCPECRHEYEELADRRYHAQPDACAHCGPAVMLVKAAQPGRKPREVVMGEEAVKDAVMLMKKGNVVAVKGLGGYHLACDAGSDAAVLKLKKRKGREDKPLALMCRSLADAQALARAGKAERELLLSSRRPIVLLRKHQRPATSDSLPAIALKERRRERPRISAHVAPANNYLGIMLPYTPLHELLMLYAVEAGMPALVMTSGNASDEPLTKDDNRIRDQLGHIADAFLMHNRPIHSRCDDSVVKIIGGGTSFIRRARGYVPAPIHISVGAQHAAPVLAAGGELKNTFCLLREDHAFVGPHIGDLKNAETMDYYRESLELFQRTFRVKPEVIACDMHPDYLSTRYAEDVASSQLSRRRGVLQYAPTKEMGDTTPLIRVQHHHAHIASCLAENGIAGPAIGVALDGTGYGTDGNIWGGEVLLVDGARFERLAHFDYVPLPGGDAAALENGRMAVSYLYHAFGDKMYKLPLKLWKWFPKSKARQLVKMMQGKINSPLTSSCGRLFDAVAALFDLCRRSTYDGQAAVAVEMAAERCHAGTASAYEYALRRSDVTVIDFRPTVRGMVKDLISGKRAHEDILMSFHATVIKAVARAAARAAKRHRMKRVALSGGAFQNKLLAEGLAKALAGKGLEVLQHRQLPPNDGSISLGQAVIARLKV